MTTATDIDLDLGAPVVVATSEPGEDRWGYYQFPDMWREPDGTIVVTIQVRPDDDRSLDQPSPPFESTDDGRTWTAVNGIRRASYLTLANGDELSREAAMFPLDDITLPEPVGTFVNSYGLSYPLYRWPDLDPELAADCFRIFRRRKGSTDWQRIPATIDDPGVLCTSISTGVFVPFGDWCCEFHLAADNSVIYQGYRIRLQPDGTASRYTGPWLLRSTDGGESWTYHGSIAYEPDREADADAENRLGFTEPTMLLLDDDRAICVMRTTDGTGLGPMYQAESSDGGRTWARARVIAATGSRPQLLRLANGVLVLSSGRPGVEFRCSADDGATWSDATPLITGDEEAAYDATCGYTDLLATGPDRFLIAYSDFKHKDDEGGTRKALLVREIAAALQRRCRS